MATQRQLKGNIQSVREEDKDSKWATQRQLEDNIKEVRRQQKVSKRVSKRQFKSSTIDRKLNLTSIKRQNNRQKVRGQQKDSKVSIDTFVSFKAYKSVKLLTNLKVRKHCHFNLDLKEIP